MNNDKIVSRRTISFHETRECFHILIGDGDRQNHEIDLTSPLLVELLFVSLFVYGQQNELACVIGAIETHR